MVPPSMSKPKLNDQCSTAGPACRRGGWRFWAGFLAVAALALGGAFWVDDVVQKWLVVPDKYAPTAKLATGVSETAKGHWPVVGGLMLIVLGRYRARIEWRRMGLLIILATGLAGLSAMTARGVIGRARPYNTVEQGWFGPYHDGRWTIGRPAYNAFPSGHTATATGLAFALILVRSRWKWLGVAWAIAVAWSRIAVNYHHLSDTVAAAAFGFVGAWLVVQWMESDHFQRSWVCRVIGLTPAGNSAGAGAMASRSAE